MTLFTFRLLMTLSFVAVSGMVSAVWAGPRVTVFAAASLKNALDDVAAVFQQSYDIQLSLSYAGSSGLARQIQYGAPAQIFISANMTWMQTLEAQGLLVPETKLSLLGNQLALIAGSEANISLTIGPEMDLIGALNDGRLALASVNAVPAGIYAQKALISLGVWDSVKDQTAQSDNVRAALRLVALGEAPLGIVYATDAASEPRVKVLGLFPDGLHPAIIYPAAQVRQDATEASGVFFQYLSGPEAAVVFQRHGFGTMQGDG